MTTGVSRVGGLNAKQAKFARPGVGDKNPKLTDPFGNVLRFDDVTNHE